MRGDAHKALSNKVREFNASELLRAIAQVSAHKYKDPDEVTRAASRHLTNPQTAFPEFILAEISKIAIQIEDRPYYRRDKVPIFRDLSYLQGLYLKVDAEQDFKDLSDLDEFMFRLSSLQFSSQGPLQQMISRTLLIHTQYASDARRRDFDVLQEFHKAMGLSLEDYTFLGVSMFALAIASRDGLLHLDHLAKVDLPQYEQSKVSLFLELVSTDFDAFRGESREKCDPQPGLEIYDYNPLVARPIVMLPSGQYVLPVPRMLVERVTSGVYYDLAEKYGNEFLTYLGHAYQRYIGRLFEGIAGIQVMPETEYGPKRKKRLSSDWIVSQEKRAAVIECKTKRLRLGGRLPHMSHILKEDIRQGVTGAVAQLSRCVEDIRRGNVFAHLADAKLFPMVVTLDQSYLFNTRLVRGIVRDQLSNTGAEVMEYQVASTEEIEFLTAFQDGAKLVEIIERKFETPEIREYDLFTLIRDSGGFKKHPLLESTYREFLSRIRLSSGATSAPG